MLDLTEVPVDRLQDSIASAVERVAARRAGTRGLDLAEARTKVEEVVERTAESSAFLDVVDGERLVGSVWLGTEADQVNLHDVVLVDADLVSDLVALLVERGRAQGARTLGIPAAPDQLEASAVAAQPGFQLRATNMVLALDSQLADPAPVELRAMTPEEFEAFMADQVEGYAEELAAAGLEHDRALEQSRTQMAELIPSGPDSPGMEFSTALVDGRGVGYLWLSIGEAMAFVYDIEVRADERRKGYGEALMNAGARHCRDLGHQELGLNVFAHNPGARALYDKLGYRVAMTYSTLDLADAD